MLCLCLVLNNNVVESLTILASTDNWLMLGTLRSVNVADASLAPPTPTANNGCWSQTSCGKLLVTLRTGKSLLGGKGLQAFVGSIAAAPHVHDASLDEDHSRWFEHMQA